MTEWLDSIAAEVLVSQFSKVPAPMRADRMLMHPVSNETQGENDKWSSTPICPTNHSIMVAGTNPLIGLLPTKMQSLSKLRHKTSMGSH